MEIQDFIEKFGISAIVKEIGLSNILDEFTSDEVMWELDDDDMADYLADHRYDFSKFVEKEDDYSIDDYSDKELLYELCKRHSCRNYFTKEDVKEKINEILDDIPQYTIGD